jgi:hypothetical protein
MGEEVPDEQAVRERTDVKEIQPGSMVHVGAASSTIYLAFTKRLVRGVKADLAQAGPRDFQGTQKGECHSSRARSAIWLMVRARYRMRYVAHTCATSSLTSIAAQDSDHAPPRCRFKYVAEYRIVLHRSAKWIRINSHG